MLELVEHANRRLHPRQGLRVGEHVQTSDSEIIGGDERGLALANRQRGLGHVAKLGRERFVLKFLDR